MSLSFMNFLKPDPTKCYKEKETSESSLLYLMTHQAGFPVAYLPSGKPSGNGDIYIKNNTISRDVDNRLMYTRWLCMDANLNDVLPEGGYTKVDPNGYVMCIHVRPLPPFHENFVLGWFEKVSSPVVIGASPKTQAPGLIYDITKKDSIKSMPYKFFRSAELSAPASLKSQIESNRYQFFKIYLEDALPADIRDISGLRVSSNHINDPYINSGHITL